MAPLLASANATRIELSRVPCSALLLSPRLFKNRARGVCWKRSLAGGLGADGRKKAFDPSAVPEKRIYG